MIADLASPNKLTEFDRVNMALELLDSLPTEESSSWSNQIITVSDTRADRPDPVYVVPGLIREKTVSVWFGRPGKHKTNVVMDLAVCASAGISWEGFPSKNQQPMKVLWIDQDSGEIIYERLAASTRGHNIPKDHPNFELLCYPDPQLNLSNKDHVGALITLINERGHRLVVIDTLKRASGTIEENSDEMDRVLRNARLVAERTGAAIIIIHHSRKNGTEELRGSSAIEGAVDATYKVTMEDHTIIIEQQKARLNSLRAPIKLQYCYRWKMGTEELAEYHFERVDEGEYDDTERQVLEIIKSAPGANSNAIQSSLGIRKEKVSNAISALLERKEIEERTVSRKKHYYPIKKEQADHIASMFDAEIIEEEDNG